MGGCVVLHLFNNKSTSKFCDISSLGRGMHSTEWHSSLISSSIRKTFVKTVSLCINIVAVVLSNLSL